ncbi:MAG: hypothetical protein ACREU4_06740, partial [Burkholderiales bacterium]
MLGWFTSEMLRLDRLTRDSQRLAAREEAIRLALWRMDSALAGVHGLEAARSSRDFEPFHALETAFSRQLSPLPAQTIWAPSPLLQYTPPFVRLHFRVDASGNLTSPQAPPPEFQAAALSAGVPTERIQAAEAGLGRLSARVAPRRLFALATGQEPERDEALAGERGPRRSQEARLEEASPQPMTLSAPREFAEQKAKSATEERQRQELYVTQNRLNAASARRAQESETESFFDSFASAPNSLRASRSAEDATAAATAPLADAAERAPATGMTEA